MAETPFQKAAPEGPQPNPGLHELANHERFMVFPGTAVSSLQAKEKEGFASIPGQPCPDS